MRTQSGAGKHCEYQDKAVSVLLLQTTNLSIPRLRSLTRSGCQGGDRRVRDRRGNRDESSADKSIAAPGHHSLEADGGILEVDVGSELGCSAEAVSCMDIIDHVVSLQDYSACE